METNNINSDLDSFDEESHEEAIKEIQKNGKRIESIEQEIVMIMDAIKELKNSINLKSEKITEKDYELKKEKIKELCEAKRLCRKKQYELAKKSVSIAQR